MVAMHENGAPAREMLHQGAKRFAIFPAFRREVDNYPTPKQQSGDLDIEEILSEDEEADVGIVAIGNKAANGTNTNRGNSSQDFLMNGELRFPDQNSGALKELTELLKTVPEKQNKFAYDRNATSRGQLVRTTKNVAITQETFVDGRYDDRHGRVPVTRTVPKTNQWSPLTPQPVQTPQVGRVQRTAFSSKLNEHSRNTRNNDQLSPASKRVNDNRRISIQEPKPHNVVSQATLPHSQHTGNSHNAVAPVTGVDDRGNVLRKRVQKIQSHSTIEVLPLNTVNHTEIPVYDLAESSEEDDADYPLSREHEALYEPDYYQQYPPETRQNKSSTELPPPTAPPKPSMTTASKPLIVDSVRSFSPTPTRTGRVLQIPGSTKPPLRSRQQQPAIEKKFATASEWGDPVSRRTTKPLQASSRQSSGKSVQPCNHNNCQHNSKPLVYQKTVGRTTAVPPVATTTTFTTTSVPLQAIPTRSPSRAANTPAKKRIVRRRRKKVAAVTAKETSPMAASGSQEPALKKDGASPAPHRQFRKRKASDDELQEPQQAAASGDDREMRVQFHMQGFSGPASYRYGFHTADPYNPLERFEERDGEDRVRGHYSYVDPTGKNVVVHYTADQNGFQIVKGDGSRSGSGGQNMGGSNGGNDGGEQNGQGDNNDGNSNNNVDENAETDVGGADGSETGPFGADFNDNALQSAN